MNFNDKQQEAVLSEAKQTLILAGPGTGKTHTLTGRIAHFVNDMKITPFSIVALTFTRKAANELKERIAKLCGETAAKSMTIGTYHGVFLRMLMQWSMAAGFRDPNIVVYDEIDQEFLVRHIAKAYISEKKVSSTVREVLSALRGMRSSEDTTVSAEALTVISEYQKTLKWHNAIDFNQILHRCYNLLRSSQDAIEDFHFKWRHFFVDEMQDTDKLQQEILLLLLRSHNPETGWGDFRDNASVTMVGDEDQSIYQWRGASPGIILGFKNIFPEGKVIALNTNYRSDSSIVQSSMNLVQHNMNRDPSKKLVAFDGNGFGAVESYSYANYAEEYHGIIYQIRDAQDQNISYKECAIIGRTNQATIAFAKFLAEYNEKHEKAVTEDDDHPIPFQLISNKSPWKSTTVKRFMDVMRLAYNHYDDIACRNLLIWPTEQVEDLELEKIQYKAATDNKCMFHFIGGNPQFQGMAYMVNNIFLENQVIAAIDSIVSSLAGSLSEDDYRHIKEWKECLEASGVLGFDIPKFLEWAATHLLEDDIRQEEDTVKIMTVHSAKGLEFDFVAMIDCADGLFPSNRKDQDMEDERRVFYVGMTRARKIIQFHYPKERLFRNKPVALSPSQFILEATNG